MPEEGLISEFALGLTGETATGLYPLAPAETAQNNVETRRQGIPRMYVSRNPNLPPSRTSPRSCDLACERTSSAGKSSTISIYKQ